MGEIVNLRSVKKRLAGDAAKAAAKENRIRHGRDKIAKANEQREAARRATALDALRRGEAGE